MDFNTANKANVKTAEKSSKKVANKASAISKKSVSGRLWLRKYIVIGLLVAITVLTAVGFSKWNIHIQQELPVKDGDTFIKYADPAYTTEGESETTTPILEHFLTFRIGSTGESGSSAESGESSESSENKSVINTAKITKDGISYYQLTYDGNNVGISVSDTYYTKNIEGGSGSTGGVDQSDIGALVGWSTLKKGGLTFSVDYYKVTEKNTAATYDYDEVETENLKNAGNYLCVLTAEYAGDNQTYKDTVKSLNSAIKNPTNPTANCAAAVYFTINPKEVTVTWTIKADGYTYNGKEQHPTAVLADGAVVSGDDCTVTVSGGINKGSHTAKATLTGENSNNYLLVGDTEYQFEIQPYTLTKSDVAWGNLSFEYDGTVQVPTASVKKPFYNEADKKDDVCTLTVTVENNKKDVGTYSAKVTGTTNENYTFSDDITAEFKITQRPITVAISTATSVYGESPVTEFTSDITSGSIATGDNLNNIFTLSSNVTKTSPVGEYDITGIANDGNYDITFTGGDNAYEVTTRKIKVILKDESHVYGSAPKALEWSVVSNYATPLSTALANGDKEEDIFRVYVTDNSDKEITLQKNTAAGEYKIKCEKLDSNKNYEVARINEDNTSNYAAYTVEKAQLTVTPIETTVSKGKTPDYKYEISGFVLNETQETVSITGNVSFASSYTGYPNNATESGTFEFWIDAQSSNLQAANYCFNYSDDKATLTVEENIIKIPVPEKFTVSFTYDGATKSVAIEDLDIYKEYSQYIKISRFTTNNTTSATDAGTYTAQIALTTTDGVRWQKADDTLTTANQSVEWTISPCKLSINNKVIEKDYSTSGVLLSKDLFTGNYAIIDGNSKTQNAADTSYTSVVTINYARNDLSLESSTQDDDNGKFYYESGSTITAGSTYEIKLTLTDTKNYVFDNGTDNGATTTIVYLKYKTASVGGTLYTIEDALKATESGNIILQGGTPYVLTAFSKLELRQLSGSDFVNYNFSNGTYNYSLTNKDLILPYADGKNDVYIKNAETSVDAVYSVLILHSDVTLNVTKHIKIAAYVAYSDYGWACVTKDRGVVMNQGKINVKSGGAIDAYGYLKGEGRINLDSGATITDLFHMYGFGASLANNLADDNFFPISSYTLHNVSCTTIINKGSTYSAYYCIEADETYYDGKVEIISNTKNALFQLQEGYIEKSSDKASKWSTDSTEGEALKTIKGSNQLPGQRDIIKMYNATVNDNVVAITLAYKLIFSTYKYTIKTSAKMACPIAYMDITVCNGSKLTLTSSSYKLYAGSTLTIDNGATLETSESISMLFLDVNQTNLYSYGPGYGGTFSIVDSKPAQLIVNGNADIKGAVTGNITSTNANAIVSIGTNQATTVQVAAINSTTGVTVDIKTSDVMYTQGIQSDGGDEETMEANAYISVLGEDGETCYWKLATDVKFVNFDYQGGSGSTFTKVLFKGTDGKYVLTELPIPYDRDHYAFVGWFTDAAYSNKVDHASTYSDNNTITLYAKWEAETFTIEYRSVGAGGIDLSKVQISNTNKTGYEYGEGVVLAPATTTTSGYYFVGWFTDENCTMPITKIEAGTAQSFTIYGLWTNEPLVEYTITFDIGDAKTEDVTFDVSSDTFNGLQSFDNSYIVPQIKATWNGHTALLNGDFMNSSDTLLDYKYYTFSKYFVGWNLTYTSATGVEESKDYDGATPLIKISGGANEIKLTAIWADKAKLTISRQDVNKKNAIAEDRDVYFARGTVLQSDVLSVVCAANEPTHYAFKYYKVDGDDETDGFIAFTQYSHTLTAYYQRYYHIIIGGDYNNLDVTVSDANKIYSSIKDSTLDVWIEPSITEMTISGKTDGKWYKCYITSCGETSGTTLPNGVKIGTVDEKCTSIDMSFEKADSTVDIVLVAETQCWYKVVNDTYNSTRQNNVTITPEKPDDVLDDVWYKEGANVTIKLVKYGLGLGLGSHNVVITDNLKNNETIETLTASKDDVSANYSQISTSITISNK